MDAVILEAWELKAGGTRIGTLSLPLTHAEAAGFVRSHWLMELDKDKKHIGGALKTTQDLKSLEQEVRNRVFTAGYNNIRHQWTLIGGEKDASRQKHFEGYLYQCLRDSNFESR